MVSVVQYKMFDYCGMVELVCDDCFGLEDVVYIGE